MHCLSQRYEMKGEKRTMATGYVVCIDQQDAAVGGKSKATKTLTTMTATARAR